MKRETNNTAMRKAGGIPLAIVLLGALIFPMVGFAQGPSAKVMVKETGFYRVTKTQLGAYFSMTESNAATNVFQVLNMGKPVPSIRDNGDLVFFGHRFNNPFTDENVYWVKPGMGPVLGVQVVTNGSSPFAQSFTAVRRVEQQAIFRADIIRTEGAEFEDPIYWRLISSGLSTSNYNATVTIDSVTPATGGALKVRVKGATDIEGRYYHRARILLNNVLLGSIDFEGFNHAEVVFTVPSGLLTNGNNIVRVQSNPPVGTTFDSFYLDFLEVTWQRNYTAVSNRLVAPVSAGSVEMSSFNNTNLIVWNVSDPWNPMRLNGAQITLTGTTNVKVNFNTSLSGAYAAVRLGSEMAPFRMTTGSVINLKSPTWQIDHLTIAEPLLLNASLPIKNRRASQGLQSELISIDDVYDSFNHGIRDPRAIQALLGYAYRNWTKFPKYVFLVGDGSLDYKNGLGAGDSGIPSMPVVVSSGMYASDYLLGDIDGNGQVEIAVGRLPVNAVSNVNDFVSKMVNYEDGGAWRTNTMITTDLSDYAGNFYDDGNYLEQVISEREVHRADMDIIGATATREEIIDGVNVGKEVTVYIGHGTPNQLSLQSIILTSDSVLFTNSTAPSTFVMIGCLVGSFANPAFTSMGEALIKAKGGASSFIAAATLISAADGRVLTEEFLNSLYTTGDDRIGDAWIKGKNQLTLTGRVPAFRAFQLLGDPGMAVGNLQAPAQGNNPGPSRGSYDEWKTWAIPPVLNDTAYGSNPGDDADGDKFDNYSEYMAGTDPFDGNAFLEIVDIARGANNDRLVSWPSAGGRTYRLECASAINGTYQAVGSGIPATAPLNIFPTTNATGVLYYRVVVE